MTRVRIKLEDVPMERAAVAAKPAQTLPMCPPAGIAPLQAGTPGTGDHRVTLTWNASAASKDPNSAVVGYCLYRSKIKHAAKKNPICTSCEQINRVPISAVGCVDDVVLDGTKYYYVVTAIDGKSTSSAPSNEIPVSIPPAHSVRPLPPSALPLCRVGLQPQAK